MTRNVWALCALVALIGSVACKAEVGGSLKSSPAATVASAAETTPTEATIADVTKELAETIRYRDVNEGWAAELKPGDRRSTREVEDSLAKLSTLEKRLEGIPNSDKVAKLHTDIYRLQVADCALLLRKARGTQDIWALGQFVRHAKTLDVALKNDFGVETEELRKEALVMAKKEVLELRPRVKEGSGDAMGALLNLYGEWEFTPMELGLNTEETKLVMRRE